MAERYDYKRFLEYLEIMRNPDRARKVTRLDFLNPDESVAFTIGGGGDISRFSRNGMLTRAFIKSGSLNVSLNNGQRRKLSVTFDNLDSQFDYAVNSLWFGDKVRLNMGVTLSDGSDFVLPQGTFYFNSPSATWKPNSKQITYTLSDKWSYLDGSLFGNLNGNYLVEQFDDIFAFIKSVLTLSRYDYQTTTDPLKMFDPVTPVFSNWFYNHHYTIDGIERAWHLAAKRVIGSVGESFAKMFLELNTLLAGTIGYDAQGILRIEPSASDIDDSYKPTLFRYTPESKTFLGLTESSRPTDVFNDIIVIGESLSTEFAGARATNRDPLSDTCVQRIGLKTFAERNDLYYDDNQCSALAAYYLKKKTVLQKSITLSSTQMFHFKENAIIEVARTDKVNVPVERHLISSYTIPLSNAGEMTINATSVNDFPKATISTLAQEGFINQQEEE